jgi:hypothetical protein
MSGVANVGKNTEYFQSREGKYLSSISWFSPKQAFHCKKLKYVSFGAARMVNSVLNIDCQYDNWGANKGLMQKNGVLFPLFYPGK